MSNTLPFGTPVICISHNNFKQARGRVHACLETMFVTIEGIVEAILLQTL